MKLTTGNLAFSHIELISIDSDNVYILCYLEIFLVRKNSFQSENNIYDVSINSELV